MCPRRFTHPRWRLVSGAMFWPREWRHSLEISTSGLTTRDRPLSVLALPLFSSCYISTHSRRVHRGCPTGGGVR
jgi:hypothetical protein